jgi:outer membrane protein assembly factor BamD
MQRTGTAPGPRRAGLAGILLALLALGAGCASTPSLDGLDADTIYQRAVEARDQGEWDEAIRAFDYFLLSFPGEERAAEARFNLAEAHFAKEEYITAAAEFARILTQHPSHGLVPQASLGVCRSYEQLAPVSQRDQSYTERAVDACRETINEFPGMTVAEEAREIQRTMIERLAQREYEEGHWYERRGLYDQAIIVYRDLVDFYPQTAWAPRGFLGLYRSYRAIEWNTEAEEVRGRLLANYPDSPEAQELRDGADARGDGAAE